VEEETNNEHAAAAVVVDDDDSWDRDRNCRERKNHEIWTDHSQAQSFHCWCVIAGAAVEVSENAAAVVDVVAADDDVFAAVADVSVVAAAAAAAAAADVFAASDFALLVVSLAVGERSIRRVLVLFDTVHYKSWHSCLATNSHAVLATTNRPGQQPLLHHWDSTDDPRAVVPHPK
jgi:hypothetical protein